MYQTQQWTAPQGTGLNRYAKGTETETHITLTLDPESITNTPTPFTAERMAHIEKGISDAHDIFNTYPLCYTEKALGQNSINWLSMTTRGSDVYACVNAGYIYKQTNGTGDFVALGNDLRSWYGMTTLGNNVYASVYGGDIYVQTGGVGDFVGLGQASRAWFGMTTLGNNVYACVSGGDIYKQTGGVGDFVALGQESRYWKGMTTLGNNVYASVENGDIYVQTNGTGDFVALGQDSRRWFGMTTLGSDVYACVINGDIYKQTGGVGDFVALGQTARAWIGITTLGRDIYVCVNCGDIYKLTLGNTIRASADFTLSSYPDGSRKRIANTHAANTNTCTLPSGQTMNGQSSFTIAPDTILEFELIGTAWKCVSKEWEYITEITTAGAKNISYAGFRNLKIDLYRAESAGVIESVIINEPATADYILSFYFTYMGSTFKGAVYIGINNTNKIIDELFIAYDWTTYSFGSVKIYGMK